jgi:hypothetical protein
MGMAVAGLLAWRWLDSTKHQVSRWYSAIQTKRAWLNFVVCAFRLQFVVCGVRTFRWLVCLGKSSKCGHLDTCTFSWTLQYFKVVGLSILCSWSIVWLCKVMWMSERQRPLSVPFVIICIQCWMLLWILCIGRTSVRCQWLWLLMMHTNENATYLNSCATGLFVYDNFVTCVSSRAKAENYYFLDLKSRWHGADWRLI